MCIAIYKPEGYQLTDTTLKNSWDSNPDGAGFMYPENGVINIVKGLMTYDEFRAAYDPHKDKQTAVHFRIATHGGINPENTHPFKISDNLGVIHNGVINKVTCTEKEWSDTWHFTERYLKPLEPLWQTPVYKELCEAYIGHSKLVLLSGTGEHEIYNEQLGVWDSDCWFSNRTYEDKVYIPPTPKYSHFKKSQKDYSGYSAFWDDYEDYYPKEEKPVYNDSEWKPTQGDEAYLRFSAKTIKPLYAEETLYAGTKVILEGFGENNMAFVKQEYTGKQAKVPLFHLEMWSKPKTPLLLS